MARKKKVVSRNQTNSSPVPLSTAGKSHSLGIPIREYADRVYDSQSPDLPETFILSKIERALIAQEYPIDEVRKLIQEMMDEI